MNKKRIISVVVCLCLLVITGVSIRTSAATCTCKISIDNLSHSQGISLPYMSDSTDIEVIPTITATGPCSISGHPTALSSYTITIEVLEDTNHIYSASIRDGDKTVILCRNIPYGTSILRLRYVLNNGYQTIKKDMTTIGIGRRYPPPVISADGYFFGNWSDRDVTVRISGEPGDTITYKINGGIVQTSSIFTLSSEGSYEIKATGSGAIPITTTQTVKIDKTAPNYLAVVPRS